MKVKQNWFSMRRRGGDLYRRSRNIEAKEIALEVYEEIMSWTPSGEIEGRAVRAESGAEFSVHEENLEHP